MCTCVFLCIPFRGQVSKQVKDITLVIIFTFLECLNYFCFIYEAFLTFNNRYVTF